MFRKLSWMDRLKVVFSCAVLSSVALVNAAQGENWPRFRGPGGSGVAHVEKLPARFGPEENVRWSVKSGPGVSSPIVFDDRLWITSFDGDQRSLACLDADSGKPRWTRTLKRVREEPTTPPSGPATPTPTANKDHVYAFFPDAGLACYSHSGDLIWSKDLGPFQTLHGISSSLILAEGLVILVADQLQDSFIAAFDMRSGEQVWKLSRPDGLTGGYSTPVFHQGEAGTAQIISVGPLEVCGYDPRNGEKLWRLLGVTNSPMSGPLVSKGRLWISEPVGEPISAEEASFADKNRDGKITLEENRSDKGLYRLIARVDNDYGNANGILETEEFEKAFGAFVGRGGLQAVDLPNGGDASADSIRWTHRKSVPQISTPLLHEGILYLPQDGGRLTTLDADTGKVLQQGRLRDIGGQFYASPVAGDGKVFLSNTEGKVAVVETGTEWKVIEVNDLKEPCFATPAISGNRLFVRTASKLYCFETRS